MNRIALVLSIVMIGIGLISCSNGNKPDSITKTLALTFIPNTVSLTINANGVESIIQQFILVNGSSSQVTGIGTLTLEATPADFSIISNTCGSSLNPGATCIITTKYGPTTTAAVNVQGKLNVPYNNPDGTGSSTPAIASAGITFNGFKPLIIVESIVVTNANNIATGTFLFTNSPLNQILIAITYKNTGTENATNFNVALNNLPIEYFKHESTTCATGNSVLSLNANQSCVVAISAINPNSGSRNPYAFNGAINVNIPGFSYTDSNGANSVTTPTYNFGNGLVNQINVIANKMANVVESNPTTVNRGTPFNLTFTATILNESVSIFIPELNNSTPAIFIVGPTNCSINAVGNSCSITLNSESSAKESYIYTYNYVISPSGESQGIIEDFSFILQ